MFQQTILYVVTIVCLCWPYYYYPNTHVDRLNQQYSQWRRSIKIQPRVQPPKKDWHQQDIHGYRQQYLPIK
jgi:hypothetical protein